MTNFDILNIQAAIDYAVKISTPEELKPFSYAFLKNKVNFKSVFEERNIFTEHLAKSFVVNEDWTEKEKQLNFEKYALENEDFKKFLSEETTVNIYTISIASLEGKEFNLEAAEKLIGTVIIE